MINKKKMSHDNIENVTNKKLYIVSSVLLMLALGLSSGYIFYRQANYNSEIGMYRGDLLNHLDTALSGGGYSLMASLYRAVYKIVPSTSAIAILLATIVVLTVVAGAFFIGWFLKETEDGELLLYKYIPLSVGLVAVSTVYIPVIYPYFYKSTYLTQPWHNPTYLMMRLLGILVILIYFKIEECYLDKISWKESILFTVLLVLVNYAKPNFIIAFAPMMLIYLIIDFVRTKGKSWLQNTKFGICVLLSLPILYVQSTILYPDGGDAGIVFSLSYIRGLLSSLEVIPYFICGLLFPIVVTAILLKKGLVSKQLQQSWVMWTISWLEKCFLAETGFRASHGNFGWGSRFFTFFLIVMCAVEWIRAYKDNNLSKKTFWCGCTCLALHIICGIYYYMYVLTGQYYLI